MSIFVIALLLSLGASTWVYNKLQKTTGGNTKNAIIGALVVGVLLFIVAMTLGSTLLPE